MGRSLRTRLLLAVSVLALTAVAAVALSARLSTREEFRKFRELERISAPPHVAGSVARVAGALGNRCCAADAIHDAAALLGSREALVVVDDDQQRVVASAGPAVDSLDRPHITLDDGVLTVAGVRRRGNVTEDVTLQFRGGPSQPLTLADGRAARVTIVALPQPGGDPSGARFLGSVDRQLLFVTLGIGLLAVAATWMLTRRLTGPLHELRDAARALAAGDLSRRVDAAGTDEVAELGRGFNTMAADLERQQALRRDLVRDVAHELRTPLTALRCRLESILDGFTPNPHDALRNANDEVRHLSQLVDDLQELAQAEARELRLSVAVVHVAAIVDSAARAAGLDADPRFRHDVDRALTVRADAVRMRQVLLNLLTNAGRHAPEAAAIVARARPDATGREVLVEVHNTGSTLDDDQLSRVFDRFYRVDPARQRSTGGSGLGLAIVKHLVEAQGGRVWAAREGAGVTFGFALPV